MSMEMGCVAGVVEDERESVVTREKSESMRVILQSEVRCWKKTRLRHEPSRNSLGPEGVEDAAVANGRNPRREMTEALQVGLGRREPFAKYWD